jgi:hypothetical protein
MIMLARWPDGKAEFICLSAGRLSTMKPMGYYEEMMEALRPDDGQLRFLEWNWPGRWSGCVVQVPEVSDEDATDVTNVFIAYFMNKRMMGGVEVEQLLWKAAWDWKGCMPETKEDKVACAADVYRLARAVSNGCLPAHRMLANSYVPAVTPRT